MEAVFSTVLRLQEQVAQRSQRDSAATLLPQALGGVRTRNYWVLFLFQSKFDPGSSLALGGDGLLDNAAHPPIQLSVGNLAGRPLSIEGWHTLVTKYSKPLQCFLSNAASPWIKKINRRRRGAILLEWCE